MAGLLRLWYAYSMRIKDERQLDKDLAAAMRSKGGYVNLRAGLHAVQTKHGRTNLPMASKKGVGINARAGIPNDSKAVQAEPYGN
jgi:hypothetical protein